MSDFPEFAKIPRLHREVVITEKIDGTNGLIQIERLPLGSCLENGLPCVLDLSEIGEDGLPAFEFVMRVGSRRRWITPDDDNYGFAAWAWDHAEELITGLGVGRHYGEWYGKGIQRGYGLNERRFALFNVAKWDDVRPPCCDVVPVIVSDDARYLSDTVADVLDDLRRGGSFAVPGWMRPEGIVVYHTAANSLFKVTLENDEKPKRAVKATGVALRSEFVAA